MNLGQMREMVREAVRDANGNFVKDWELDGWVNEAYADLAARLRLFQKQTTGSVTGGLAVPADLVEIQVYRVGSQEVEFVDDDTFWAYQDEGSDVSHPLGRIFNKVIETYPSPTNATYVLRYYCYPADINSMDESPDMAPDLQVRIVNYARGMALMKDHNPFATNYLGMYERNLPEPPRGQARIRKVPLTVQYEPNAFDLDADAKHR